MPVPLTTSMLEPGASYSTTRLCGKPCDVVVAGASRSSQHEGWRQARGRGCRGERRNDGHEHREEERRSLHSRSRGGSGNAPFKTQPLSCLFPRRSGFPGYFFPVKVGDVDARAVEMRKEADDDHYKHKRKRTVKPKPRPPLGQPPPQPPPGPRREPTANFIDITRRCSASPARSATS